MLLTQQEAGLRDNLALLRENQHELTGDTSIIDEYVSGNISYWQALAILDDHVSNRVSDVQYDTQNMLIIAAVMISLDFFVYTITALWHSWSASKEEQAKKQLSERELLLKRLSHNFKGTIINLQQSLEEIEGHPKLKATVEHMVNCIEAIVYQAGDADATKAGQTFDVGTLMGSLHQLYPRIELEIRNRCMVVCVPCLLYVSIYQLFRNAFIHGGAHAKCTIYQQGRWCVITVFNTPGENHKYFLAEADAQSRTQLALSGRVAKVSSSSMGLADVIDICAKQANTNFDIDWNAQGVLATLRLPMDLAVASPPPVIPLVADNKAEVLVTHVPLPPPLQQDEATSPQQNVVSAAKIRLCFIDDQIGPRMAAMQLARFVHPQYTAPSDWKTNEACWEDHLVKVGGATSPELQECIDWVNTAPLHTIVLLDRMLEYPGEVVDGLDLIPALQAHGAVVLIRSGNCSDYDREMYKASGAFGSVSKALYGSSAKDEIQRAQAHLLSVAACLDTQ